jgi:TP901 family phage tail tape measure protein
MAEDTYSLKFTAVNQDDWALNGAGKTADLIPPDASAWSQPFASGADQQMLGLNEAFAGLGLALAGASLQIGSLSAEQGRLTAVLESINTTLTSQRSLLQAMNDMPAPASRSGAGAGAEQKSQSTGSDNPPYERLKPAINLDAAMVDLGLVIHFEGDQRRALAITNEKMATEALVAPSKATAIDLAGVEYTAAKAGIGNEQRDSQGNVDTVARQGAIVEFTRDAAITASAFKLPVQETAELLIGWRTSMNLDRLQTQDLADATSVLASNMSASEADIGSILSNYGAAGTNAGLAPEQAAAFSTALLNAGVKPTDAGVAFEKITTTLARGSATTPGQQAAWAQLGLDPKALASGMQTNAPATLQSVLEALKRQPVAERAGLATQLFSVDRPVLQLLQNLSEVERAFSLVSKKENYTNSKQHQHSAVQQAALTRSTSSQAHWNVFNAQLDRL